VSDRGKRLRKSERIHIELFERRGEEVEKERKRYKIPSL